MEHMGREGNKAQPERDCKNAPFVRHRVFASELELDHPCPIVLVRKGPVIQALATKALRVGELAVPLFLKKQSSVVTEDEGATIRPRQ